MKREGKIVAGVAGAFGIGMIAYGIYHAIKAKAAPPVPPPPPVPGYATLYGRVSDTSTGVGISEVSVALFDSAKVELITTIFTDAEGDYQLANILPDNYIVVFSKAGYKEMEKSITLRVGLNELNVKLTPIAPLAYLTGQVSDATTGYPIAGVKVTLDSKTCNTDAEGIYTFLDLAPGTYTIKFEKSGYETVTM